MDSRQLVEAEGGRHFLADVGLLFLGAVSALFLVSFGGQIVVAPILVPLQWVVARRTSGFASMSFSVLGSILLAEATWLAVAVVGGEGALVVALGLPGAVVAGTVFFRTSRPGY